MQMSNKTIGSTIKVRSVLHCKYGGPHPSTAVLLTDIIAVVFRSTTYGRGMACSIPAWCVQETLGVSTLACVVRNLGIWDPFLRSPESTVVPAFRDPQPMPASQHNSIAIAPCVLAHFEKPITSTTFSLPICLLPLIHRPCQRLPYESINIMPNHQTRIFPNLGLLLVLKVVMQ